MTDLRAELVAALHAEADAMTPDPYNPDPAPEDTMRYEVACAFRAVAVRLSAQSEERRNA